MYSDLYSDEIVKKLIRIKKKDQKHYVIIRKKMDEILQNPKNNYKFLHYSLKGINRVHIGHFVLLFVINHENEIVSFEDYDHHDKIYR
ncbi:MAG: hypothetical protein ABIJ34_08245 [archaeon]